MTFKNTISIICSVYQSHKIFAEQLKFLHKELRGFDKYIEIIFVDDGSEPCLRSIYNSFIRHLYDPIFTTHITFYNFKLYDTESNKPWNQAAGRNLGANKAHNSYLLFFDIDHIITKEIVVELLQTNNHIMKWKRAQGSIIDGLLNKESAKLKNAAYNIFGISCVLYDEIGGYNEKWCGKYGNEDSEFFWKISKKAKVHIGKSIMYYYPNAKDNIEDFHGLHITHDKITEQQLSKHL